MATQPPPKASHAASVPVRRGPRAAQPADVADPAWRAVWSSLSILVLIVLVGGYVFPFVVTEVAQTISPDSANGSLLQSPNGTYYGTSLLGQNVTNPCLFWPRPSMIDYQAFTGAGSEVPYGPTDPNLRNITHYYAQLYGLTNVSVPIDLFSASASGLDPDITPEAALVQVPRVAENTNLTQAWLTDFVEQHVSNPLFGFVGPSYVNVLQLDVDLLPHFAMAGAGGTC